MTSGSEPFGLTALEAINQDTPVIVSKTSGVVEVLPNAITVDFWDVDKYADYAINILLDADFQQFLTTQQSHDLAKLTWKQQVDTLIGIYHELLNTNKYSL
jgi:glycosyltransferase involved in cell wall biosynthesis